MKEWSFCFTRSLSLCQLAQRMMQVLSYDVVGKAEPYCEGTYLFAVDLALYNQDNTKPLKHCSVGINITKFLLSKYHSLESR